MSKVRFVDNVGVSAFGNLDGKNALVTASADGNNITFIKGDTSKFTISVTGGGGETINTGSLLTTGSVSNNVLTFTKGDGTTFILTVDTGSGGGSVPAGTISSSTQITEFGFVSQSGGIVNLPTVKIQYANVYANLVDLPAANTTPIIDTSTQRKSFVTVKLLIKLWLIRLFPYLLSL